MLCTDFKHKIFYFYCFQNTNQNRIWPAIKITNYSIIKIWVLFQYA